MKGIEIGYIKFIDGIHTVLDYSQDAEEINLDVDEYYAIFVPDTKVGKVEIDSPYYHWGRTETNEDYYVYAFGSYESYSSALNNM